ncbi:MAG: hypothetical protein JRZ94_06360, partial [Nitrososphaerota archaeon]|nr:hypothetical protein [Nitrososphaerota archaeon]
NKLFNIPIQIQGFAADDAFTIEDIDMAETMMGVDGKLSGGWIPVPKSLEITLQADSASNDFFDAWVAAESVAKEKYTANGSILLQGTGRLYVLTTGFLKKGNVMPPAKKVLQPRKFTIEFQSITGAPV